MSRIERPGVIYDLSKPMSPLEVFMLRKQIDFDAGRFASDDELIGRRLTDEEWIAITTLRRRGYVCYEESRRGGDSPDVRATAAGRQALWAHDIISNGGN